MISATIKFCGGCNPRYDRGAAASIIKSQTSEIANFSPARDGMQCDVLIIIRGCHACHYLYEESINAKYRFILENENSIDDIINKLKSLN